MRIDIPSRNVHPCPETPGAYYAASMDGTPFKSMYMGNALPYNDQGEIDALDVLRNVEQSTQYPDYIAFVGLRKLCLGEHAQGGKMPGPRFETVSNIVVAAPGAEPFVPRMESTNLPLARIVPEDGSKSVVPTTLSIVGHDPSLLRYSTDNPVPRAIKVRGNRYFVLDVAVDTLILTDKDGQTSLAPKNW